MENSVQTKIIYVEINDDSIEKFKIYKNKVIEFQIDVNDTERMINDEFSKIISRIVYSKKEIIDDINNHNYKINNYFKIEVEYIDRINPRYLVLGYDIPESCISKITIKKQFNKENIIELIKEYLEEILLSALYRDEYAYDIFNNKKSFEDILFDVLRLFYNSHFIEFLKYECVNIDFPNNFIKDQFLIQVFRLGLALSLTPNEALNTIINYINVEKEKYIIKSNNYYGNEFINC